MDSKIQKINNNEFHIVQALMILNIWVLGCKLYKNPIQATRVVYRLLADFKRMMGSEKLLKAYKLNGKYVWDIYNPAWPSKGFSAFFTNHLKEIENVSEKGITLRRLIIAITKRCPLQCEHCSEGASLYTDDILSFEEFVGKIDTFVNGGVGQLVYSGGEPLSRFNDLLKLLSLYKKNCDQWIYTSAFGLTYEKAVMLKEAGLNGAAISLDHYSEEKHNQFRGNNKSYYWVLEGIKNLQKVGVLTSINICPTKHFIESDSMGQFVELISELKVPIVNILEPRAVGNYEDKDVELEEKHKLYLEAFCTKYNFNKKYSNEPTLVYPAAFRKEKPCGGGKSYLLLDYDGTYYPCPFCKTKMPTINSKVDLCEAN